MKIRDWWDNAIHSGKAEYKTLENLVVVVKTRKKDFSMAELNLILDTEIETFAQWWKNIGSLLYKDYQAFANDLNTLVPAQRPIQVGSISDWNRGRRSPIFIEWRAALFAFTAMPIYYAGEQPVVSSQQTLSGNIEVLQALTLMQKFSVEFLKELSAILAKNLSGADREKVRALVREHLQRLYDIGEDCQTIEKIEKLFS